MQLNRPNQKLAAVDDCDVVRRDWTVRVRWRRWGIVTDFVDPASNEQIASGELTLEKSDIQIDAAGFFRSRSVGVVDGKHFRGEWGGHFFGNGESSADPPVRLQERLMPQSGMTVVSTSSGFSERTTTASL